MRSIHLIAMFALLATAARADYVSVSAGVLGLSPSRPGCGGDAEGTIFASTHFACDFIATDFLGSQEVQVHESYSASATAETGLGPYGIGGSIALQADGNNYPYSPGREAFSRASFSATRDVIVRGAQGNGYVIASLGGGFNLTGHPFDTLGMTLFNQDVFFPSPFIVPITYNVPYIISLSASTGFCNGFDYEDCLSVGVFLSDLEFYVYTDDGGQQLVPGAYLETVPEISSWLLLATCAIPTVVSWLRRAVTVHGVGV